MLSIVIFALSAAQTPQSLLVSPAPVAASVAAPRSSGGLISTTSMTVTATVVDRCKVGAAAVTCDGAAPIRAVVAKRAARTEIIF
jgi:hypothetical protein